MGKIALALALASCGAPVCVTRCGLELSRETAFYDCAGVQTSEDMALKYFPTTNDTALQNACPSFQGYTIELLDMPAFKFGTLPNSYTGLTQCEYKRITLAQVPYTHAVLVHELAHVAQHCVPSNHYLWDVNGIDSAITAAKTEMMQ